MGQRLVRPPSGQGSAGNGRHPTIQARSASDDRCLGKRVPNQSMLAPYLPPGANLVPAASMARIQSSTHSRSRPSPAPVRGGIPLAACPGSVSFAASQVALIQSNWQPATGSDNSNFRLNNSTLVGRQVAITLATMPSCCWRMEMHFFLSLSGTL